MPHAAPSAHVGTPPNDLIQQISRLSQSGYRVQLVGPEGEIRNLDTSIGLYSPASASSSSTTSPVKGIRSSPLNFPDRREHLETDRRFSTPVHDRRALSPLMTYGRRVPFPSRDYDRRVSLAGTARRILPPIPDPSENIQSP